MNTFLRTAETELASVRRSLLIFSRAGQQPDMPAATSSIARVRDAATALSTPETSRVIAHCGELIPILESASPFTIPLANQALDLIAEIEAVMLDMSFGQDDIFPDVGTFVDSTFEQILPIAAPPACSDIEERSFEIDEETIEIFRLEADELLSIIENALNTLGTSPGDQEAVWQIRRSAHTLKGSAGIVGIKAVAEAAHSIEDLLDRLVENNSETSSQILEYLSTSARAISSTLTGESGVVDQRKLTSLYDVAISSIQDNAASANEIDQNIDDPTSLKIPERSTIVRVSISRLDELMAIADLMQDNAGHFQEQLKLFGDAAVEPLENISGLSDRNLDLSVKLKSLLLNIRMVRFSTLETRLARVVNTTCIDEGKKANFHLANPDVEVDTCVIDALVEPLIHLLKNAVVHGIEAPETRRLIGKPESGGVTVTVEVDDEMLVLTVADDGAGISISGLGAKAIEMNVKQQSEIAKMSDREITKLIFERGLTTAKKVDLNSGRGVGMSIVKESVENLGGTIFVESQPQEGTVFTVVAPLIRTSLAADQIVTIAPKTDIVEPEKAPLVLVVEDSSSILRHISRIIEEEGCRVISADNGADALELLLNDTYEPDLIFSDIEMPLIDGWAFLEYVKTDKNFGHIPVVMISSLDSEEDRGRAFALGAAEMVAKPFEAHEIRRHLDKLRRTVTA